MEAARPGMNGNPLAIVTAMAVGATAGAAWLGWTLPTAHDGSSSATGLFECAAPAHHDGDAIRCNGEGRSMRLDSIDAPEMPGSCRRGRQCTPGDPFASRDHLASLTRGKSVQCRQTDTDHYGRRIVRCSADGIDLSCRMVADGFAVERYGRLDC